ncbi:sensor histidine kinase [Streptomyces sp. NPDC001739]
MRNRLVGAVAVVAVAVLGAGAPGLLGTADDASNSQHLVDLAELNARAIALAHSLADERDGMTGYAAAGHNGRTGTGNNGANPGTGTGPGNGRVNGTGSGAGTGTVNGTRTGGATGTGGRASTGRTSTTGGSGTTRTTTGATGTATTTGATGTATTTGATGTATTTGATGTGTGLPGVNDTRTNTAAAGAAVTSGPGADNAAVARPQRARVDRQIDDLRTEAQDASGDSAVYATAAKLLKTLPETRQKALARTEPAEQVYRAYTDIIQALGAISDDIARGLPARADSADADTRALPALARATDQAAGTRALLLAGLNAGGSQPTLTGLAQVARVREQAALGDFRETAGQGARDRYDRTVTGTDISTAERYLTRLTDQPRLDAADLRLSRQRVENALTTRIGLMRGVESAMATADIQRLGQLRDDDVTELEIRIGLEGLCLLLAVGAGIWAARSMTQPLAALRIGARRVAADPAHEDPITYKGRNDEFAATVRSVNALHTQVGELSRRTTELEGERKRLIGGRQRLVAEREVLQEQGEALKEEIADLTERLKAAHSGVQGRFVNLALRTLGLVERQLAVIEGLEETEQDPERLDTLFKLDHFAARMRRNSENLLVLAGAEQHGNNHPGPVPLLDVLRAAVSEIERYERVRIQSLPPHSQVAGFAADDLSHLVAELLENATAFSPPDAYVELSGWLLESGEVMLSVQDEGIGMTAERMAELNERLSDAEAASTAENIDEALGLGLYVVVRLAARHGVRVQLRDAKQGGVTAVIVLPGSILPTRPGPASALSVTHDAHAPGLPGSVAEANSNALRTRVPRLDPAAGRGAAAAAPAPERAADPAPGQDGPAGSPEGDPFVAAAERAIDAAGIPAGGTAEHTRPRQDAPEEPAPAAAPAAKDPYAIGPDQHSRAEAATPATAPAPTDTAPTDTAPAGPEEKQRTSLGLPKRTPKIVAQQQAPTAPRKSGAANAEALRRRLGGFQQGARTGRRDVAAELAEGTTGQTDRRPDTDGAGAPEESHIVEEARE